MFQMVAMCCDLCWNKYLSISSMSSGTSGLCVLKQSRSSLSAIELMHRFWRLFGLSVVPWVPNLSLKPADVPYTGKREHRCVICETKIEMTICVKLEREKKERKEFTWEAQPSDFHPHRWKVETCWGGPKPSPPLRRRLCMSRSHYIVQAFF